MTGRPWIQPCDLATAKKKTREPPFPPPLPGELHWFDLVACDRVKLFALPHYAIGCSKSRKVAYRVYFRNAGSSSRESGRLRVRGCPFLGASWWRAFGSLIERWRRVADSVCIRCSEPPADGDTSGMRNRSPIAHTNKTPTRDRTESCVHACNQCTTRRTLVRHWSCSARPHHHHSMRTEDGRSAAL